MKKIISVLLSLVMVMPFIRMSDTKAINFSLKKSIQSESAILMNLDSDMIIHEKNADTKQMPGTLVNIMVAVVVLEKCRNLSEEITMSSSLYTEIENTPYTSDLCFIDIVDGDILSISDLLYAMMLTSSMEASQTLANRVGEGSIEKFVGMMNDKAKEIGMTSTHFTNPTGLYDENQYTTARDMAILTKYALSVPLFDTISSTYKYNPAVPNIEHHPDHNSWFWYNVNPMFDPESEYYYKGTRGIKTANLEMSGRNIVAMASRDGNNYLAVLLRSPFSDSYGNTTYYHLDDAEYLFDWAFRHFSYQTVLSESAEIGEIPVSLAEGNDYVLAKPKEEISLLWYDEVDISTINKNSIKWFRTSLQAPVEKGELLGELTLKYSGEEIGKVDIVAVSDVKRSWGKYNLFAASMFPKSNWFRKALIISGILCAIYILMCIYSFVVFKSKSKPLKPRYTVPKIENKKKKK